MRHRTTWFAGAFLLLSALVIGLIAAPSVLGSPDHQANATEQQQTVDAVVAERFQQTADALAAQGPALTQAFNETVEAQFNAALTATAAAQSGAGPISVNNATQIVLRNTLTAGSSVQGIAFRPNDMQLASAHADGLTRVWDLASRASVASAETTPTQQWPAAYSPDGSLIATGTPAGVVEVWNADSGQLAATYEGHTGAITALVFSNGGDLVISASADGSVRLWDVASGQMLNLLEGHVGGATSLALNRSGILLASGDAEGTIRVWSAALESAGTAPAETPVPQATEPAVEAVTAPPVATATPGIFPTDVAAEVQIVEQVFENGRMTWIRFNRQIWVMVAAEGDPNSGDWYCYYDTFEEGEPEIDPDLTPPSDDLIQPRRGFGKLWRENPEIQEAIGWALTPEFELTSDYIYIAGGTVQDNQYLPGPGEHRLSTLYGQVISFYESEIRGECQGGTWHLSG